MVIPIAGGLHVDDQLEFDASAKSTYCSTLFPTWFLARNAGKSIVCASLRLGDLTRIGCNRRCHPAVFLSLPGVGVSFPLQEAARLCRGNQHKMLRSPHNSRTGLQPHTGPQITRTPRPRTA